MALSDFFGFFDPSQPYRVRYGLLPHWEQVGATYFITFRLKDSIPAYSLESKLRERDEWLVRNELNAARGPWFARLARASFERQYEYFRWAASWFERSLDECHGSCLLEGREVAWEVASSLLHFDGFVRRGESKWLSRAGRVDDFEAARETRYHISDFVVMPNHVHVLVCFRSGVSVASQCESWKRYTARAINARLGRRGALWQPESFDHLVRDADHFERFRRYIADNPRRANLSPGQYLSYSYPPL